ncbi:MAG: hypothetical protein BroJett033_2880 [Chloroflexota bacterium]|nr:MAG: hypothetical protein BroJett033_2880 [Chloroflexota bacterium]
MLSAGEIRRIAMRLRGAVLVNNHLHDAPTVAQVNENNAALIAPPIDPAGQDNGLSSVLNPQFAARM